MSNRRIQSRKPRVLLVPDYSRWILGKMAKEIIRHNPHIDFYLFTENLIWGLPDEFTGLARKSDVVHWLSPLAFARYSHLAPDKAKVTTIHHVVDWGPVSPCLEGDAVMTVSTEWRDFLVAQTPSPSKIVLIPNGVDSTVFKPLRRKKHIRRELGLGEHDIVIGFFASYSSNVGDRKGVDILLESLAMLKSHYPNVVALVLGPGWEKLEGVFEQMNVQCCRPGFVPDKKMPHMYAALDFYVITARIEGGPVPLLESMSCGVPVVTTSVGMARDIVRDGFNGFLVPKNDPTAVASAIVRLVENPALAESVAKCARETILNHYQWQHSMGKVSCLYEQAYQRWLSNVTSASMRREERPRLIQNDFSRGRLADISFSFDKRLFYEKAEQLQGKYVSPVVQQRKVLESDNLIWVEHLYDCGEQRAARQALVGQILLNPLNYAAWRLLVLRFADQRIVQLLRAVKTATKVLFRRNGGVVGR